MHRTSEITHDWVKQMNFERLSRSEFIAQQKSEFSLDPKEAVSLREKSPMLFLALLAGRERGVMLPGGWLFPGQNPVNPMTARQLSRIFHGAKEAAGIDKRVSLHTLRHCFATHLLEQGVDIRVIQILLGHKKLETTARYSHIANTTLKAVKSPLDFLQQGPLPPA